MTLPSQPMELTEKARFWIGSKLGIHPADLGYVRLQGSTSTTLFRIFSDGGWQEWVFRLFDNAAWLAEEPDLVKHESAALITAAETGLPVPRLISTDAGGKHCGVPALLMTSIPGEVLLKPGDPKSWLRQMAGALARLHAVQPMDFHWRFSPYNDARHCVVPGWADDPQLWQQAIELAQQPWPQYTPCFIHRDYHPVNLLFTGQTLTGIVDWPNACLGPSAFDAAWCRINLVLLYGIESAELFLQEYLDCGDVYRDFHPFWDLLAILEALPGPPEFYPPWQQFGMQPVTQSELIRRLEGLLKITLKRL